MPLPKERLTNLTLFGSHIKVRQSPLIQSQRGVF